MIPACQIRQPQAASAITSSGRPQSSDEIGASSRGTASPSRVERLEENPSPTYPGRVEKLWKETKFSA